MVGPSRPLILAAFGSFAVAALHLGIVVAGAPAYRFFGAGEGMARAAEAGSWRPAMVTIGLAALFALWGWYALSGAGFGPRLPFLAPALVIIAAVYLARGAVLAYDLYFLATDFGGRSPKWAIFSAASLLIGAGFAIGAVRLIAPSAR
jgi:hypothetical protein